MTVSILGGLLLIVGAWYVYRGDIFKSVFVYFVADICWVVISFTQDDWIGSGLIAIGMTLGLLSFIKMNSSKMHKSLHKDRQ